MNIGDNIKRIREERSMTQQQIANLIGMHRSNYSKIEKGQREISVAAIIKIANHFDITVDELLSLNKTNSTQSEALLNINNLSAEDQSTVYRLIELLLSEQKLKELLKKDGKK
jgi:transcriptional regulator with XRE-family HTH domain